MNAGRRKLYLCLIALGAVALFVDRVLLTDSVTNPSTASGQNPDEIVTPAIEAKIDSVQIPEVPFPSDLARFSTVSFGRDLFAEPAFESTTPDKSQRGERTSEADVTKDITDSLKGVYIHGAVSYAVIGGQIFKVGDRVQGCELAKITGTEVTLTCPGNRTIIATVPTSADHGTR